MQKYHEGKTNNVEGTGGTAQRNIILNTKQQNSETLGSLFQIKIWGLFANYDICGREK